MKAIKKITIFTVAALTLLVPSKLTAQSSANELERATKTIGRIKKEIAPDSRQAVFDVKAFVDGDGLLVVGGKISEQKNAEILADALADARIDYESRVTIMPDTLWALVSIPVASLRTAPRHSAEMATQAVMGTPVSILEKTDNWNRVQCPDGYIAYVPASSLNTKSTKQMDSWRKSQRFIVSTPWQIQAFGSASASGPRDVVTELTVGSIVEAEGGAASISNGRLHISLPDGRTAYAEAKAFTPLEEWAAQDFNPEHILDIAYSMEGVPYLWGGTSSKATDCSGLVKTAYFANGIILMRDASQQANTGGRIEAKDWRMCHGGDLVFFGNKSTGKVTHVGIYDKSGNIIHSSGRVKRNSIDPDSENYLKSYHLLHATRIDGHEESRGITRARNHPWYFNSENN